MLKNYNTRFEIAKPENGRAAYCILQRSSPSRLLTAVRLNCKLYTASYYAAALYGGQDPEDSTEQRNGMRRSIYVFRVHAARRVYLIV